MSPRKALAGPFGGTSVCVAVIPGLRKIYNLWYNFQKQPEAGIAESERSAVRAAAGCRCHQRPDSDERGADAE